MDPLRLPGQRPDPEARHSGRRVLQTHRERVERMILWRNISSRLLSVWRRDLDVSLVTWHSNLAAPLVETTLYVLAFGMGLGAYVGKMPYAGAQYSYIVFIAPGMICSTILFHAFFSCLYG